MNIMEELPASSSSPESKPSGYFSSSPSSPPPPSSDIGGVPALGFSGFDWKNVSILILLFIVILTYMGINVLKIMGDLVQSFVSIITPATATFLQSLGYTTGTAINAVADVTTDVARTGIDVAEGTAHNVGNLMIGTQQGSMGNYNNNDPQPDGSENSIQKSMSASKTKWCLAGEYQKKRGCIDISESDKCLSGEVFPSEEMCMLGKPQFQSNN
jgi:hypothetical protein